MAIEDYVQGGKRFVRIDALFRWEKNPKIVLRDDFDRLKRQIKKFGQFKPLIVLDSGEVIGGNTRLEAMKDLGIKKVWIEIVSPKSDAEKVEISLADNDEVGKYVEEDLAELVNEYKDEIELKDYKINFGNSVDLDAMFKNLGPNGEEKELKKSTLISCPECGNEFEL